MSLQQFLVVGRSFANSPSEKSPFEMRKEVRLPTFENAPRFAARPITPVQTDWIEQKQAQAAEPISAAAPVPRRTKAKRKRSWLEIFSFGLLGRPQANAALVQGEMNLENIRVMRNDLADSDLEVVFNKKKKFRNVKAVVPASEPETTPQRQKPQPKERAEWSELTARLFEIGQH